MRIDTGGRMVIPDNDLVRGTDLVMWPMWVCLRGMLDREGITGSADCSQEE